MKSLHFFLLCFLTTILYLYSLNISHSSSSLLIFVPGRRSMRELRMSSPTHKVGYHNIEVVNRETKQSTTQEGSMTLKYASSSDNLDELAYHIDYHGVTTHPTPTPKHPKP